MSVFLRKKSLSDGRQSLYLDVYLNGRRSYEFLNLYLTKDKGQNKEALALGENIRGKRMLELGSAPHGLEPQFKKKANFVEYFEALALKKETEYAHVWRCVLPILKDYTKGVLQCQDLTPAWLEGFKAHLLTKVASNTARSYFSKIRACIRQALKDRLLIVDPLLEVGAVPKTETEKIFLTEEELAKLIKAPCPYPEVKRAFLFACNTGLRLSDIEALTWGKVQKDSIQFRQKKTGGFEYLPLNEAAKKLLLEGRKPNILPTPDSLVFNLPSRSTTVYTVPVWRAAAQITKHVTFHSSRHTFATMLISAGVDLYTVSKLLGHSEIRTTEVYAKVVDKKKMDAVNSLHKIGVAV